MFRNLFRRVSEKLGAPLCIPQNHLQKMGSVGLESLNCDEWHSESGTGLLHLGPPTSRSNHTKASQAQAPTPEVLHEP